MLIYILFSFFQTILVDWFVFWGFHFGFVAIQNHRYLLIPPDTSCFFSLSGSVVIIVVSAFWVFRQLNILKEFALEKYFYSLDPSNYLYTYVSLLTNMVD